MDQVFAMSFNVKGVVLVITVDFHMMMVRIKLSCTMYQVGTRNGVDGGFLVSLRYILSLLFFFLRWRWSRWTGRQRKG